MNSLSQRIRSFTSLKWALKPIAPRTLAKLGYHCISYDMVECTCCKFTFEFVYTVNSKPEEKIIIDKILQKAKNGHDEDCIFVDPAQGLVDDDVSAFTNQDRIFYTERHLINNQGGIISQLAQYPKIGSFIHSLNQSDFELLWLNETVLREEGQYDCASLLALMGYRAKSSSTLECCFCFKQVNLEYFQTKKEIKKLSEEYQVDLILKKDKFIFEPAVFHSEHCVWLEKGEEGTWRGVLSTLRAKYEANKKVFRNLKKFKQIADQLRIRRAGYRKAIQNTEKIEEKPSDVPDGVDKESAEDLEERVNKRLAHFREKLERAKAKQNKEKRSEISVLKEAVTKQYEKVFKK